MIRLGNNNSLRVSVISRVPSRGVTQGELYYLEEGGEDKSELEVKVFMIETNWNYNKSREHISDDMGDHIVHNIKPALNEDRDISWWMGNSKGEFSFHLIRKEEWDWIANIWVKGLPFKINFFYGGCGRGGLLQMIICIELR